MKTLSFRWKKAIECPAQCVKVQHLGVSLSGKILTRDSGRKSDYIKGIKKLGCFYLCSSKVDSERLFAQFPSQFRKDFQHGALNPPDFQLCESQVHISGVPFLQGMCLLCASLQGAAGGSTSPSKASAEKEEDVGSGKLAWTQSTHRPPRGPRSETRRAVGTSISGVRLAPRDDLMGFLIRLTVLWRLN